MGFISFQFYQELHMSSDLLLFNCLTSYPTRVGIQATCLSSAIGAKWAMWEPPLTKEYIFTPISLDFPCLLVAHSACNLFCFCEVSTENDWQGLNWALSKAGRYQKESNFIFQFHKACIVLTSFFSSTLFTQNNAIG